MKYNKNYKIDYHDTNVLLNDKYYKSLRILWKEFDKSSKEESEDEKINREQAIVRSTRSYALSLISFTCKRYLGYDNPMGRTGEWVASHKFLPSIITYMDNNGIIYIKIGNQPEVKLIVSCSGHHFDTYLMQKDEYLLSYGVSTSTEKAIRIDVKDVDSTERIGALLRKYIIKDMFAKIKKEYEVDVSNFTNLLDLLKKTYLSEIVLNKYHYLAYPQILI